MNTRLLTAALSALATTLAAVATLGSPQQAVPTVIWSPIVETSSIDTDEIFPAEILALANMHVQELPANYLGDAKSVLGVKLVSSEPRIRVKVSVSVDKLVDGATFETSIPEANREYEIWPTLRFDTQALARIQQSFPTTAVFSVSVNGVSLGERTLTIRVRSVNDVPFLRRTRDGRIEDLSFLFAAFVAENHPWIDGVLSEALRWQAVRQFSGYQASQEEVLHQVFAIWNVLQRRQARYSSITRPSGQSETIMSQHVRFLDETITASQANCVDGTVLFASIIYKLGMCPVLVLTPGHMFLGFHLDAQSCGQGQNLAFLETTLIGNPGLNVIQRGWKFWNPDTSYRSSESYRQFFQALNAGETKLQSVRDSMNNHELGYLVIDVERARRAGISSIPRF